MSENVEALSRQDCLVEFKVPPREWRVLRGWLDNNCKVSVFTDGGGKVFLVNESLLALLKAQGK